MRKPSEIDADLAETKVELAEVLSLLECNKQETYHHVALLRQKLTKEPRHELFAECRGLIKRQKDVLQRRAKLTREKAELPKQEAFDFSPFIPDGVEPDESKSDLAP